MVEEGDVCCVKGGGGAAWSARVCVCVCVRVYVCVVCVSMNSQLYYGAVARILRSIPLKHCLPVIKLVLEGEQ